MKAKRSQKLGSDLNETGIFLFLTLVIFFGAIGFPTLINTTPTFGYDQNTIQMLTPVTSYYQQAFAEKAEMNVLGSYYFDPNIVSAMMILPTTVDLPPPDFVKYFELKYSQLIELDYGLIEFDDENQQNHDEKFIPKYINPKNKIKLQNSPSNLTNSFIEIDKNNANLKSDLALGFINGIPMSWFKIYWLEEKEPDETFNLLPKAEGAEFYVRQTDFDSVRQTGTGSDCPAVTSPSSALLESGTWTFKASTGSSLGCSFGIISYDDVLLPLDLENYLLTSSNPFWWGVDWGSTAWNSGDNSGNTGCDIRPVSGANSTNPNIDARINATAGYEAIYDTLIKLTSTAGAGLCDSDNAERYALKDASGVMTTDYLNRDNKTFYQVGAQSGNGIGGRDTISRTYSSAPTFLKYIFLVPANNTDNYWQMQEHPMFEATFPAISTGFFGEIGSTFQMRTGDVNSEIGQTIIFKSFNKTEISTLADIRIQGEFEAIGTTSDMKVHIEVKEGNIQAGQNQNIDDQQFSGHQYGNFPLNERMLDIGLFGSGKFTTKSSLNINNSLSVIDIIPDSVGVPQTLDVSLTPYWAGSLGDVVTVMVGIQDNSASGRMVLNLTSIEIENEVKYDFESVNNVWFNEPDCSTAMATTTTSTTDLESQHVKNCGVDYSNGLSKINTVALSGVTGIPNPTPDAVTGLDVTFIGDIANLTWNHPQTNVTSFKIERNIGAEFTTLFYVPAGILSTVDRTSQDLVDPEGLFGLPRSTSITYRVTPMNGDISGGSDTDTKTSNTISDDWQWKEYNFVPSRIVNQTIIEEGGSEKRLMMNFVTPALNSPQGDGWLFKVFPKSFIESKQIEIDWEGTKTGTFNGGFLNGEIHIFDGVVNRFNTTQFDVTTGGAGGQTLPPLLYDFDSVDFEGLPFDGELGRETKIVASGDPSWGSSTSELITLAVVYHDGGGKEGNLKIASIKVDDAFYNFSSSTIITEEQNLKGNEQQDGTFDFELLDPQTQQDTGLVIPSSANVTISTPVNLVVTQNGGNGANLDWSDTLGADNYQVFRNDTLIGSPILSQFSDSGLSISQVYAYKVRANNTGGVSGNSTIVNFTLSDTISLTDVAIAVDTVTITLITPLITAPQPIVDLQVRIKNTTTIFSGGADSTTEDVDQYPAYILQTFQTPTNPTLIDSFSVTIDEDAVGGGNIGTITGVILGDRMGDLNFDSLESDIYFIENSTNIFSTSQTYPVTLTFNFTGNTILDSIDFDTGIGILVSDHTNELRVDIDTNDGTGFSTGNALFLGNVCGSSTTFEKEDCSDGSLNDLADLQIYGGNARAVLNWTAPADNGDAIIGYEINIANATGIDLFDERDDFETRHNFGTSTDNNGFAGQRITFPNKVVIQSVLAGLGDGTFPPTTGIAQGVILKNAPNGTSSYTRVANSTNSFDLTDVEFTADDPTRYLSGGSDGTSIFIFNNTVLDPDIEYIVGMEVFGVTGQDSPCAFRCTGTSIDSSDASGHPFSGLGNFTYLDVNTGDIWNTTNDEWGATFFGYNYTKETENTGNTNIEYTSTADFPSSDKKINAYSFNIEAINSGGIANASNFVEISPDRESFDTWNYLEQNTREGVLSIDCLFKVESDGRFNFTKLSGGIGDCVLFKSFNKTEIDGSDMRFVFQQNGSIGNGRLAIIIVDGAFDKDSKVDFPFGVSQKLSKGGGQLNRTDFNLGDNCGGFSCTNNDYVDHTISSTDINYVGSTEDEITVFLLTGSSNTGTIVNVIPEYIAISNVGSWNFTQFPRQIIQVNNSNTNSFNNNQDDRGILVSNGIFIGNVTVGGVNATQSEQDFVSIADEITLISPPFPITTLTGNTVSDSCQLSWSAPPNGGSPIINYQIYRSVDGAPYVFLLNKVTTSHIDTGLANNILYEYNVTATNAFGDSEPSNIVDCMPITTGVPSEPTVLQASEQPNGDVTLTWLEPATGDPTGYRIERKIAPASFSTIVNDTGTTSLTYLDITTNPATEYTYRVAGWNSFGLGAYSNEAVITTASPPVAPVLTAQQVGDVITVNWTQPASANPITGYKIDRRVNLGTFTTFIANTSNTNLSITDTDVMKPNTYGYRVRALSSSGEGAVSNVVDVVFGSHVIVQVREQDGSGFKGGGLVRAFNSTFTQDVALNVNSNAIFNNFATGNFNYTFIDNSNFILNKTFNFPFPSGNLTSTFTISALVFDVDCPDNGVGTDVRIKVNYTDAKDIVSFPSLPVCDSTDQVSWSTRWVGENMTDTSIMVADFISTVFKANAEQFLASATLVPTSYSGVNNAITSDPFQVNATDTTINFNLFLGRAPAGGGGGGSGSGTGTTTPSTSIPNPTVILGQRLTGLSLLSRTHQFAQAGDIIEGSITVNWEGEKNLSVKGITPTNTDIDIRFGQIPFDLNQRIDGIGEFAMSTADIPYTIVLQPQECNQELGITQNCFEPVLHTIPLEFKFERDGQQYDASTEVFVDGRPIPLDIVQLQIILLFLVLVASAVFGGFIRNRFRKKTQRTKKVKQKFRKKFDSS